MNNPETGWSDWECKLNKRTAIRRAHAVSIAKMRRWIFFLLEILLALIAVVIIAHYDIGNLIVTEFMAAMGVVCTLMSFCAGYFLGATKR